MMMQSAARAEERRRHIPGMPVMTERVAVLNRHTRWSPERHHR